MSGSKGLIFSLFLLILTSDYCTHYFKLTGDGKSSVKAKAIDGELLYVMPHDVISLDKQQWQHLHRSHKNSFFIMVHSKNKFLLCYIQCLQTLDTVIWIKGWVRQAHLWDDNSALVKSAKEVKSVLGHEFGLYMFFPSALIIHPLSLTGCSCYYGYWVLWLCGHHTDQGIRQCAVRVGELLLSCCYPYLPPPLSALLPIWHSSSHCIITQRNKIVFPWFDAILHSLNVHSLQLLTALKLSYCLEIFL